MDALRKSLTIAVALAAVICLVPLIDDGGSEGAGTMDGLMLYEVYPFTPEGVAIHNYGSSDVDLKGYSVADQKSLSSSTEGWFTFTESIMLHPGESLVVATEIDPDCLFTNRGNAYEIGTHGIESGGRFNLADEDDVYLYDAGGNIVDAMCYGGKTIDDPGLWIGDSVGRSSNTIMQRQGTEDTDSADDWTLFIPGRTDYQFEPGFTIEATVTPFLFPDSGGIPIYQALEGAGESVCINIFMLTNRNIYALLCDLEERGVEVKLLLEGEPTGSFNVDDQASYIRTLVDAGGEVRLIGVGDDGVRDRYDVDHAKYAIIDSEIVVVTSENWVNGNTTGSLVDDIYASGVEGNRGWGAVFESREYASYMQAIFDSDWNTEFGDTKPFDEMERYSNARPATLEYDPADSATFRSYQASITPFMSPDNSFEATEHYISDARERVYSEQQSLSEEYQNPENTSPLNMMKQKAGDGLDVRLLISTNVDDCENVATSINMSSKVLTGVLKSPYIHNKGLVCDDISIVSSVNWTSNSFHNNREMAVAIHSQEIADFFADAFLADFYQCYTYDGYRIDMSSIEKSYVADVEVALSVDISPDPDGLTIEWDFGDGTEPLVTDVPRVVHVFRLQGDETAGAYTITITLYDSNGDIVGTARQGYTVTEDDDGIGLSFISEHMYLIVPALVALLAIVAAAVRSMKKKRR